MQNKKESLELTDPVLTNKQAQKYLGLSEWQIKKLRKQGVIKYFIVNNRCRYNKSDLDTFRYSNGASK